jgi:26S proteasome regulatory subunit T1
MADYAALPQRLDQTIYFLNASQREYTSLSFVIILTLSSIDWEKTGGFEKQFADDEDPNANKEIKPLDEGDIQLLKTYGQGPYARTLKKLDDEIKEVSKRVNDKIGVKESDMGLAPPNLWDLLSDRQRMNEEHPLQVARCTKIIQNPDDPEKGKYIINVKQIAKFGTKKHSPLFNR